MVKKAKARLNTTAAKPFVAPLKSVVGKRLEFPGINTKSRIFTLTAETAEMQAAAAAGKSQFVKDLAKDPQVRSRFPNDITRMEAGQPPAGFDVHHKTPLKFGGTNDQPNFILMQNYRASGPNYHSALTNYQNSLSRNLDPGTTFETQWPEFSGKIYP